MLTSDMIYLFTAIRLSPGGSITVHISTQTIHRTTQITTVHLNNKILTQVTKIKYLGIILDHKFRFQDHITYAAERCTKIIHSLSKVAKMTWGIKHAAMDTIYKGAILPLLFYGVHTNLD